MLKQHYSITELTEKANETLGLEGREALNPRRTRDYVTRVLGVQPGRGHRVGYDGQVYFQLLALLRLRQKAPKLEFMDIGRIIRSLPEDVVERLANGDERLELPALGDADAYARHLRGDVVPDLMQRSMASPGLFRRMGSRKRRGREDAGMDRSDSMEIQPDLMQREELLEISAKRTDEWITIRTDGLVRLQVRGPVTIAQQRQLEKIGELVREIVESSG